jgi:AAA family ATP:ADP antiporter
MKERILEIIWPIKSKDYKKFFPMAAMLFFILFIYDTIRPLKDSLVVPNIGAESVSFIKLYLVLPGAIFFAIIYAKLTNLMNANKILYTIATFFISFFLVFGFIIYPNPDFFHPSPESVHALMNKQIFGVSMDHFKWFIKIYEKWSYVLFYVFADLWGSIMINLIFWQFANSIIPTVEAKRIYPMFSLVGHIGPIFASHFMIKFITDNANSGSKAADALVWKSMVLVSISTIIIIFLYKHINSIITKEDGAKEIRMELKKSKLGIVDGFRFVFSSYYLGLIALLVFCYGSTINLVETLWKSKVQELYPTTVDYAYFNAYVVKWISIGTMIFTLISAQILKRFNWYIAGIITPMVMLITGSLFFSSVIVAKFGINPLAAVFQSPLFMAVFFGALHNVFTKSCKYSIFDSSKEIVYIPADPELKSKGKAAVDVVGSRFAKSAGAFIQSAIFIIFPSTTYTEVAPYFLCAFLVLVVIWIFAVKNLSAAYNRLLRS